MMTKLTGFTVILDANALMLPMQGGPDLTGELTRLMGGFDALIPAGVMSELEAMARRPGDARAALSLARKMLEDGRARPALHEGTSGADVDTQVLELAVSTGVPVVTNDRELIGRLKGSGVRVIRLRGKAHLDFGD